MSSFGDFIALSAPCDLATARIISREVSDGIIAPGYSQEALDILAKKKGGKYCVLQVSPTISSNLVVFGHYGPRLIHNTILLKSKQDKSMASSSSRNATTPRSMPRYLRTLSPKTRMFVFLHQYSAYFLTISTFSSFRWNRGNFQLPKSAVIDLIVATLSLKYTQSNSVAYAFRGSLIGIGAGQQSRIHCTRLAGGKADIWWLRHHPRVLALPFKRGVKRADKANAIDLFVNGEPLEGGEKEQWESLFEGAVQSLDSDDRREWAAKLQGVACSSDAFFPFSDNVHRARRSGVQYLAAPSGSVMDGECIKAADEHDMVFAHTSLRLFHH